MDKPKGKTLKRLPSVSAATCSEGEIGAGRKSPTRQYRPATRAPHSSDHIYKVARAYAIELHERARRIVGERRRAGLDIESEDLVIVVEKITRKALRNLNLLISTRGAAGMLGVRRISSQLDAIAEKDGSGSVSRRERDAFKALLRNATKALRRVIDA